MGVTLVMRMASAVARQLRSLETGSFAQGTAVELLLGVSRSSDGMIM